MQQTFSVRNIADYSYDFIFSVHSNLDATNISKSSFVLKLLIKCYVLSSEYLIVLWSKSYTFEIDLGVIRKLQCTSTGDIVNDIDIIRQIRNVLQNLSNDIDSYAVGDQMEIEGFLEELQNDCSAIGITLKFSGTT